MRDQYLLYIDILGFTDLVKNKPDVVDDLFRLIASLAAHKHPDFATIVFSDTVLVHCAAPVTTDRDREYVVMYLCEFASDLLSRLVGRQVAFRAVLTYGAFDHYLLNTVPCFFGPALIHAHQEEKKIKATGLFIDKASNLFNRFYGTAQFDEQWSFVFLTRLMDEFEEWRDPLPLPDAYVIDQDKGWHLGPEVLHLQEIHSAATTHAIPEVRTKYERTWRLYAERYPRATATLLETDFKLERLSRSFPWAKLRKRLANEDYVWASTKKAIEPLP